MLKIIVIIKDWPLITSLSCESECIAWVNVSNGELPSRAWIAWPGSREEETILYVGRAEHQGGMFPGTLIPHKGVAHIAWGGHTIEKNNYQVSFH